MSGTLIIAPEPIAAVAVTSGTGADNLLTPSPREIWLAGSTAAQNIDIDLGEPVAIDSFFVGSTNAATAAMWTIWNATGMGSGLTQIKAAGPARAADSLGPHHCFHRLAEPVVSRYFRIQIAQAGAAPVYAGNVVLGLAFEKHREYGPGRTPIDTALRQDLTDGGFGFGDGVVKSSFAFSFIDLSAAEKNRLWAIEKRLGLRKPVLVVEDADLAAGMNEALHYGVFERFQPYERANSREWKHAGSVIDWA